MNKKRIAVIGAGGFAREVAYLIEHINAAPMQWEFVGYVVSDLSKLSERDSREQVIGDVEWLVAKAGKGIDAAAIGIGTPSVRAQIGRMLEEKAPGLEQPALIHPSVIFHRGSCKIGKGVLLCAGVIATVNIEFGDFSMCNLACTIGHEAKIGVGTVLNPTVNVSGGVVLGDEVLVGTGSQLLQYVKVGDRAVVGAGAVVTKDVVAGVTVVGVPAKPLAKA
jgi:sugar O-acyltransferase (sialic acid O-acetyltransferase NeuD family)